MLSHITETNRVSEARMNLSKINLNLLVNLQALLEENNVTRAAQRLHITQSAMSKSLAQLRELFDDPLLVRIDNQLHPTLLAENLKLQLDRLLSDTEALLQNAEFDPTTCDHSFTIAVSDYESQRILPDTLKQIYRQAPQISLRLINLDLHACEGLSHGRVDLCISFLDLLQENLHQRKIQEDSMVCVMSATHPLAGREITLDDYVAYPHVVNSAERGEMINNLLAAQHQFRQIQLEVPLYQTALAIVADSELLLTLPRHVARHIKAEYGLVESALPFETPPLEYGLCWPDRLHRQASHRWLRQTLMEALKDAFAAEE